MRAVAMRRELGSPKRPGGLLFHPLLGLVGGWVVGLQRKAEDAPWQWNSRRWLFLLLGMLEGGWLAVPAWSQPLTIRLQALRAQIPADGVSDTTLTATVRDSNNREAPDGTLVIFRTTVGRLSREQGGEREEELQVPTERGIARVRLFSETQEVTAEVTAVLANGQAVATAQVRFGSGTSPGSTGERVVHLEANYLRYQPEMQLIEAVGGVVWSYRGLTIRAHALQYRLSTQVVCAHGLGEGVELTNQEQRLVGDRLYYSGYQEQGVLAQWKESGVELVGFRGLGLQPLSYAPSLPAGGFEFSEFDDQRLWVRARKITVLPGEKTILESARFYVADIAILTLPYYVEEAYYGGLPQSQFVGYSSYDGLIIDFPYYLHVRETSNVALKLVRGQQVGFTSRNRGLALQLVGEYTPTSDIESKLVLDRLPRRDFDVLLQHHQQVGPQRRGRWDLVADWTEHRNLYLRTDFSQPLRLGAWSCEWTMSQFPFSGTSHLGRAIWRLYSQRVPKWHLAYGGSVWLTYTDSAYSSPSLEHGASLELYPYTLSLAPRTGLSSRVNLQYARDSHQEWGRTLAASLTLQHRLGTSSSLSLSYNWNDRVSSRFARSLRESVNLNLSATMPRRWYGYLYASHDLGGGGSYASGNVSLWAHPLWRVGMRGLYQRSAFGSVSDYQWSVGRRVGTREIDLVWSKTRGWQIEMGGGVF